MTEESKVALNKNILLLAMQSDIFKMAVQSAFNHIVITDADGIIIYANSAVERITGYPIEEVLGQTPRLWGQQMSEDFYKGMWETIKGKKEVFRGEIQNKKKSGEIYYAQAVISPILNDNNELVGFIGTEEDVTENKEMDRMKTEFISITAHQLRTPLTSILWTLDALQDSLQELTEKQQELLGDASTATQKLIEVVNVLLNVTRIESGRISVSPKNISLVTVLENVLKSFGQLIAQKEQHVDVQTVLEKDVMVDEKFMQHVFQNIISNAIKYTPDFGNIEIKLEEKGQQVLFSVKDDGHGIPLNDQKNIFHKFYRATNARHIEPDGNGLGLYFVSLIVDEMKGKIWFESEEGKGTTFFVAFPIEGMKEKRGEVAMT